MIPTTTKLKSVQLRARAPRLLFHTFICILCVAGVRAIFESPPVVTAARAIPAPTVDYAAMGVAETFAREYLTWSPSEEAGRREERLKPFLSDDLDPSGGLRPAADTAQAVMWTTALGARRAGRRQLVTVAVGTSQNPVYITVPVERDEHGLLSVAAYPAIVGPPATETRGAPANEEAVDDDALEAVVERALGNYLSGAGDNLLADLTPDAVVSAPEQPLRLSGVSDVTWVQDGRRLAAIADVRDERGTTLTLRYELDVVKRDRWYVRSVQVDPTHEGSHP